MGTDVKERTKSVNAFVSIVSVESVDDISEKIKANGGEIMQPKMKIDKMGWLAYFLDTEGNMVGVMQPEM
jgi:predicted enzyme related to lactoylglutathione lyase